MDYAFAIRALYDMSISATMRTAIQDVEAYVTQLARERDEAVDKALRFDLDVAGITQRESEAVELVELRADLAALRAQPCGVEHEAIDWHRILGAISNGYTILSAPCAFCGFKGEGYWQSETHTEACPWFAIGGETERSEKLREILSGIADRCARIADASQGKCCSRCGGSHDRWKCESLPQPPRGEVES